LPAWWALKQAFNCKFAALRDESADTATFTAQKMRHVCVAWRIVAEERTVPETLVALYASRVLSHADHSGSGYHCINVCHRRRGHCHRHRHYRVGGGGVIAATTVTLTRSATALLPLAITGHLVRCHYGTRHPF
jgi:hypothetical protein